MKYEVRLNGERAVILDAHGASIVDITETRDEEMDCGVLTPTFEPSVASSIVCAADIIDALVAALEAVQKGVPDVLRRECLNQVVEDALALARGGK